MKQKNPRFTNLYGDLWVEKNDPRIEFRGQLDSLDAWLLYAAVQAGDAGCDWLRRDLFEMLGLVRRVMAAHVKGQPLSDWTLLGMDAAQLQRASHHALGGRMLALDEHTSALGSLVNLVRTQARQCERALLCAQPELEDALLALNRLSSALHLCLCRLEGGEADASGNLDG